MVLSEWKNNNFSIEREILNSDGFIGKTGSDLTQISSQLQFKFKNYILICKYKFQMKKMLCFLLQLFFTYYQSSLIL